MQDNFDLKKFIIEAKLKARVHLNEMARPAKEMYKLNPDFPQIKDRIKNPSNFKLDRKQQVINYFIEQGKEQGVSPMKIELLKSSIEKNSAPGVNWSFTPDIRTQLLKSTSIKSTPTADEEPGEDDVFLSPSDAEDLFIGKSKLKSKKQTPKTGEEDSDEPSEKSITKIKKSPTTAIGSKAGNWLYDNSSLIDKIIKQYSQSTIKTGKIKEAEEGGGLSSSDFKFSQQKSKEAAKVGLPDMVAKLVTNLEKLRDDDFTVYVKVLNDLDANLDWRTFQFLSGSHNCRIKNNNNHNTTATYIYNNMYSNSYNNNSNDATLLNIMTKR